MIGNGPAIRSDGQEQALGVANEETLKFDVRARPQGTQEYVEVYFSQDFYTN